MSNKHNYEPSVSADIIQLFMFCVQQYEVITDVIFYVSIFYTLSLLGLDWDSPLFFFSHVCNVSWMWFSCWKMHEPSLVKTSVHNVFLCINAALTKQGWAFPTAPIQSCIIFKGKKPSSCGFNSCSWFSVFWDRPVSGCPTYGYNFPSELRSLDFWVSNWKNKKEE